MAQPSIRRATAADAEGLARLGELTFRETFVDGGFAIPYPAEDLRAFLETYYTPAAFARTLADRDQACWIASAADGRAVAYASAGPCRLPHVEAAPGDAELQRLYVRRDAQGQGLGRRLLEAALGWMGAMPGRAQWLGVWSGNLKAQRFYAAYGFERVGSYEFAVGRWRDLEVILRRSAPWPSPMER